MSETPSGGPAPIIVWFRNDLRLHDHPALLDAVRTAASCGATVVPLYCLDPGQFVATRDAPPRTGLHRARFLLESLAALRTSCRERGSELTIRMGRAADVIPSIARAIGARRVFYHEEATFEELAQARAVSDALRDVALHRAGETEPLVPCRSHTMLELRDLPFELGDLPDVFTPYRRLVNDVSVRAPLEAPHTLPSVSSLSLEAGVLPTLHDLGLAEPPHDPRAAMRFDGGEAAGLRRVQEWIWDRDRLSQYKQTRNGLLAPDDSSKLSPWLALGCLSPRVVHAEVRRYEDERVRNADTEWLIYELHWRDYFRWLAEQRGVALFRAGGLPNLSLAWRTLEEPDVAEAFERWCTGRTGFPLVDAAMRELLATGYTTNRARQNVASFLTRVLGIDWRLGASWFETQLIDYDVCSNWGNWSYVAGVGTDARGFRFFNVHKQALDYDPTGAFARHWLPELAGVPDARIYRPDLLTDEERRVFGVSPNSEADGAYPPPVVDLLPAAEANGVRYVRAVADASDGIKRGVTPRFSKRNV